MLGVHLWSKQQEIAHSVIENKRTVVASCHGTGKALGVETPIPVPGGVVKMGDIRPGDRVLGADGQPVNVIATTGVHTADTYRVTLRGPDGEQTTLIASGDHLWPVFSPRVEAQISVLARRAGIPLHTGLWHHRATVVTTRDLATDVRARRMPVIPGRIPRRLPVALRPDPWLTEMMGQRGSVDLFGRACLKWMTRITAPAPEAMGAARQRLGEAGVRTLATRQRVKGGAVWSLSVENEEAVTLLPRPDDRALAWTNRLGVGEGPGWRVVGVDALGDGEVQCIQVDAPDSLYLCTQDAVPTHNSMIASVLACWWVSTHNPGEAIVVSSAPTYAQVNKILWEEIRRHHSTSKRRDMPMLGRVTQSDEWKTDDGQIVAFGRKPADGDRHAFQGIHRRYVLVILDEACGIPEELWTGAEAITTNDGCRILAIGNPDDRNTEFGSAFLKQENAQDWKRISIPARVTPNFTGEPVPPLLNEVLVSRAWCEERLRSWGEKDPRYISKVMAEFPEQSKSSLFAPDLIATASDSTPMQPVGSVLRLGVDVARFGTDLNVVVSYAGNAAKIEDVWSGVDTVSSAHQVIEIAERAKDQLKSPWVEIRVDAVGLGAGVVDTLNARAALLEEPWYAVYEMHGSASPPLNVGGSVHGYGNARAYWFDQLRQSMRNGRVRIGDDVRITDDLRMVFYHFRNGKLFIISKEEMRKNHGRSPDFADALAYATAPVEEGLPAGSSVSQDPESLLGDLEDDLDLREMSIAPY